MNGNIHFIFYLQLSDHTYLFYGAGEAGVGIANLIVSAIKKQDGCSAAEARLHIWLFDSKGVVHADRTDDLVEHKKIFAHKLPSAIAGSDLLSAVQVLKPTALVGVSAQGSSFTQAVCKEMAKNSEAPLILALSNPTSKAECTAAQAYEWTNGKCVYFSGSPMEPYTMPDGRVIVPGQGNNAYIFPGVGLGAIAVEAQTITDEDFEVAATCLASLVSDERLQQGSAYPLVKDIRGVSLKIAAAVAYNALKQGRVSRRFARGNYSYDDVLKLCSDLMYVPEYKK